MEVSLQIQARPSSDFAVGHVGDLKCEIIDDPPAPRFITGGCLKMSH